jgi:hypothetical protein
LKQGSISDKFTYLKELYSGKISEVMAMTLEKLILFNDVRSAKKAAQNQKDDFYRRLPELEKYNYIKTLFPYN